MGQGVMAKSEIDSRIEEEARTGDRPQPPVTKAISTESEKRKLQVRFALCCLSFT